MTFYFNNSFPSFQTFPFLYFFTNLMQSKIYSEYSMKMHPQAPPITNRKRQLYQQTRTATAEKKTKLHEIENDFITKKAKKEKFHVEVVVSFGFMSQFFSSFFLFLSFPLDPIHTVVTRYLFYQVLFLRFRARKCCRFGNNHKFLVCC